MFPAKLEIRQSYLARRKAQANQNDHQICQNWPHLVGKVLFPAPFCFLNHWCSLIWLLDCPKYFGKLYIFNLGPTNWCFFASVLLFSVFLEIPSTHLTMHCHKCISHMDNHTNQVRSVIVVEKISRWSCTSEKKFKKINNSN